MAQSNGQDHRSVDELINAMAAKVKSTAVVERVPSRGGSSAFEQRAHTLLIESVDKMTQEWVSELSALRANAATIEQLVIEQATKIKHDLTRLHLLGVHAMREAQRGHHSLDHMSDELDAMLAEQTAPRD